MSATLFRLVMAFYLLHPLSHAQSIQTVAGKGTYAFNGDGGPAIRAAFYNPTSVAWYEPAKTMYVGDMFNNRIRRIDSNGYISSLDSLIRRPVAMALNKAGDLYVSSGDDWCVYKYPKTGGRILIAGNGNSGYNGDGIAATTASISPGGLAFDTAGNLYVADGNNHRVRKVDTSGMITTVAGTGTSGYSGDGSSATNAMLRNPTAVVFDKRGNMFIVDAGNHRLRKISLSGIISTVAGNGTAGNLGDGGAATNAQVTPINGIVVDSIGNIYTSSGNYNCIRMIDTTGIIRKVAGKGKGFSGDGSLPDSATFWNPTGLAISDDQSLYITDTYNQRVRKICTRATVPTTVDIHIAHSNPGRPGDTLRFTTVFTPSAAGVIYKWRVNGGLVSTDSFFAYPWLSIGDTVTVEVLTHNLCNPFFRDTAIISTVGISKQHQLQPVRIYPNPAKEQLVVETKETPPGCRMVLSDIQSRSILAQELLPNYRNLIDIGKLAPGAYYLHIYDGNRRRSIFPIVHY